MALRTSFMPFYRDITGADDSSPVGTSEGQKQDIEESGMTPEEISRKEVDKEQKVAP